jgi:hypothetical protein
MNKGGQRESNPLQEVEIQAKFRRKGVGMYFGRGVFCDYGASIVSSMEMDTIDPPMRMSQTGFGFS